jgi:hypothetical protein
LKNINWIFWGIETTPAFLDTPILFFSEGPLIQLWP